ncbi:F-box/FBD/LRR-repeat protein At1g13570-like [Camellia sinensis]|uniref:F-box/FBD/LRR-repeat protein At1g13570-like n=1 Tax=Camellia sinensis TaxID=4442 RepID=UPI001036A861|nr:F-box/FBD/LRR-repeat protein At1g13570-like [Camellia sinensis]XP_028069215.1 F-box/FBD/LRR-repeat protein At1g13570-like [Camellia sinensis]
MKRIMKKMRRSLSDIISNLPESVKETILACLSIQDAVRTSVLSTKWRYTWTKLPQLVFDDTFCSDLFCKTKDKLMTIIYQVLLFHHGPIPKFTCSLSGLKSCSEFDQLILFVSKKGIQELNLNIQNGELYKLPSSLFSCLQLKILTLHSCIFKSPPEFKGFSRLLKLELYEVVVTADILSRLISSSPLLERLSLQNSTSIDCLEINAPNLRFLLCEIHAGSICLKNAVQLASIAIDLMASMDVEEFEEAETSKLVTLFGNLPVIEFLELDYYYLRYMSAGGVPKRLPTTLNNLKFLYLNQICFGQLNEILVFLCLIRSSPNLVKIRILVHTDETADDVIDNPVLKLLEKQDWSDVSLNQLRAVEMYDISIMRSELEFIKLLLAKSPMLETMIIKPDPVEVADKGPTTNVITNMSAACVPKGLQPTMNNLKTLQFLEICFGQLNDISLILCLIRSSPNLEKITIQAYVDEETNAVDPVLELLEMQEWLDVSLNQLQTVDFWNLSGTSSELEFIKLLLVISPVLEVIFIEPDSKKIVDKGVRILKELAQFPRLSPKAEIEFDDPDED